MQRSWAYKLLLGALINISLKHAGAFFTQPTHANHDAVHEACIQPSLWMQLGGSKLPMHDADNERK